MINTLDLFSGIGGFSLGLERTGGFRTVAFCDNSPKCRHLLNHHWPEVPAYDDVCTLTSERLATDGIGVDALTGGFPCQDLSYAGKGAGLDGARSGLWFEIARLLRDLRDVGRPVRLVILENVSALLGRGLGVVLGDLAALGYDAEWDCIPASAVGAPHRRDRIWIVAYARGLEHEGFGDAFRRALAAELSSAALANSYRSLHAPELVDGRAHREASAGEGGDASQGKAPHRKRVRPELGAGGATVADATRLQSGRSIERPKRKRVGAGGEPVALGDADSSRLPCAGLAGRPRETGCIVKPRGASDGTGWWLSEPDVGRVAHGVPARVDRLHGLGNAVVPEIPYRLGRAILAARAQFAEAA